MKKLQKLSTILLAEIAFMQGMDTFTSATRVSEDLNMDEVYDALDLFSNASKVAFAQDDVELEARCEAWLGKIYEKALKKESKAVGHYSNVVRLAVTMRDGRDVTGSQWYKDAKAAKEAIQSRRQLEEEAAIDRADAPFRAMIATDLENIKRESQKGCKVFLKYINENYVPAARKITLTDENLKESNLKRLMTTKFAVIFHPDKNRGEARQIQILREEI